jgi:DNA-binding beta-propeller fold protein YncE
MSVMVFDRMGQFIRQWPVQTTPAGKNEGELAQQPRSLSVHFTVLSNDGLVYLCDRGGDQIQIYDKAGKYQKSFYIPFQQRTPGRTGWTHHGGGWSTTMHIAFSHDPAQKYMFVANSANAQVDILDRVSGKVLSTIGRVGYQLGHFEDTHTLATDSKDNLYVAEGWHGVAAGRRIQKFKIAGQ